MKTKERGVDLNALASLFPYNSLGNNIFISLNEGSCSREVFQNALKEIEKEKNLLGYCAKLSAARHFNKPLGAVTVPDVERFIECEIGYC